MKPNLISKLALFAAFLMLLCGPAWAALPVAITNPGFEQPVVAEEVYGQAPTGWNAYNGAILGTDVYVYNPAVSDFDAEAPEGSNVTGIYALGSNGAEKGLFQTLAANFQEGDSYQLTVKVGYSNYFSPSVPGYRIQLLAGNTVIAEDNNTLSPAFGQFATSTVSYEYDPAHSGLVNQALRIRLINKGLVNNANEVAFDDVQLSVELANPTANAGGPYYMTSSAATLSLTGTGQPSGNATITTYEWDLDNDGQFDDATGATPAAISYADLQALYGMVDGSNTVRLRVTDSAAKTAIANATVQLATSTKYTGPTSNGDTWSVASNWDNGIPQGDLDVVILSGKSPTAWSNAIPVFTGNLTLQNNAVLNIGWTTPLLGSYNAMGTPGLSKIFMNPGSSIATRMGGTAIVPEIQLLGNALIGLGSSTQPGATLQFNYPISGAYQLQLQGNNQTSCVASFNVPNSFSSLYAFGAPYVDPGLTIRGNAAGSLGTGNITIDKNRGSTASYAILEINAANAMADTATLSISGTTGTILRMNANDTIAAFIFNGVAQPAGTYGSTTSSATYKFGWITGSGILTVGTPTVGYWDMNGTTAGAGGASPSGTWNAANTVWNNNAAGTGSVAAWPPGNTAIFSAGSDATGAYAVDVVGSHDISGFLVRNGAVSLTQGSGGNLRLTANGTFGVGPGSSGIATPIGQDATPRSLTVSNVGALTLSGNLSHTGGTTLMGGTLVLSGNNSAASGATTVNAGALFVNAANAIPGSTRNLTINSPGFLAFGDAFGSGNVQTALNNRVVSTSAGTIAANGSASTSFNFNAAGLTAAYFGSLGDLTFTGTLTPQGAAYRLAGEGGTLTMANANAVTGACSLTVRGSVALAADNDYTGATTVLANGALSLLGSTMTSGITLNSGSTLTIGNDSALGSGMLTLAGLSTLQGLGTVDVSARPVAANSDFNIAGSGTLTLGATTINANRIITNIASGTTTFTSIINGAANLSLTVDGSGNTTVSGGLTLPNGNLTKNGSGTLTLNGSNSYNITNINGGTLRLNGSASGGGTTAIGAARLQLGSASNGGLPIGNITISNPSAILEAVSADRSISNNLILDNNLTITGSQGLTIGGKLTNNNANRTLTNNITNGKELKLGNVDLSQNTTNRILTFAGTGSTVVDGIIANGGGSTAGALVKGGTGPLVLNGANTYSGTTTVNANSGDLFINGSVGATNITINGGSNLYVNGSTGSGSITMNGNSKLYVNGSTGTGNVTINNGATLLGAGIIGGNTTVANGGKLEFTTNSAAADHDKLELGPGRSLTFSGSSEVTVSGAASNGSYVLVTAPGGIYGTLPTLVYPNDWVAALSIVGNDLVLTVSYNGVFPDPPTLVGIADDKAGGSVDSHTPITYTVTFSEDMNANTVSTADFGNDGTSAVSFGNLAETTPGVFTLQVTPTTAGTLRLRINQGAALKSAIGVNLNTSSALLDNNTLNVTVPVNGVLGVTSGDFLTEGNSGGPFSPSFKTYTLTNFGSQSFDWTATKTAAWINLDSTSGTLASGATTTVTVSLNASANVLPIGGYYDTVTFTNTTSGQGNTTRGASLIVNGLPVVVSFSNLNQTYNGTPRAVGVTTDPTPVAYTLTYNGQEGPAGVPTDAGSYDIAVTVTEPGYTGSNSATLTIAKASQTIDFPVLEPVGNDQSTINLTATSSSNLPVTFTSSNSNVATVSGNTVTIIGVGTATITASQPGDGNYQAAASVQRTLTVTRTNPLAVPGGPYTVSVTEDLVLDGSGSLASHNQSITTYEWDLDSRNDGGGAFTANVTGVAPAALTMAVLQGTYGMVGGINPIRLRITDSAFKTSTVSTTVILSAPLRWDADRNYANGQNDGSGVDFGWLSANMWRDVGAGANTTWTSGKDAIFGNGGTGGPVDLPVPTSIGSLTFNAFGGTYTLGNMGQAFTLNKGITMNAGAGTVDFNAPILLGADQTWTVPAGTLDVADQLDLGPYTLTIDSTATVNLTGQAASGTLATGTGGIIKNGAGTLFFSTGPDSHQYTGPTVLNAGRIRLGNGGALPVGNMTLNGGIIQAYWGFFVSRSLGSGAGQIQLTGGSTGFSTIDSNGATVTLSNNSSYEAVWGSTHFKPDVLVLETGKSTHDMNFNNRIDLNGATRTVHTPMGPGGTTTSTATISQIIRNSQATPAGLIKTGAGILRLNGANTFNGGVTLQQGTLQLGNASGLGSSVGTLTLEGGLLNLNNMATVTVGNLIGTAGTIANNGNGTSTFIIGNGGATGGNFQGVIANRTSGTTGTVVLTKTGTGTITLSGANTYTGNTNINQGKLVINGTNGASNITVANGATLAGSGTIGGNVTVAAGGKLEFNLSTPAGSHDPLNIATGKGLTFSGASELVITSSGGVSTGTYVLVTGGNNIIGSAPATLTLPVGWAASVSIVGNELRLVVSNAGDTTPPVLTDITDDKGGANIPANTLVTYTVTFNEDMDASSVTVADFGNAGTAAVTIGTVTETSPGVFAVEATPTSHGSLQLRVNAAAVLKDVAGNNLNTTSAIADDTVLTVLDVIPPTLAADAIVDNKGGGLLALNTLVTYTVTFSEDMDASTVAADDFGNAGTSAVTIGTVSETTPGVFTVQATPTTGGTLRLRVNQGAALKDAAGNDLNTASAIADDTTLSVDGDLPTLAASSIVDNRGGLPVTVNIPVVYTVTFSEDMDASTVTAADFGNAGTSAVTIGTVSESSPGVFTVPVTPTTIGTLQLRVNGGAILKDVAGNNLDTGSAIADDTTITVETTPPTLVASSIVDNKGGGPVNPNTLVTYTVTFSEDMDAATVTAADFGNAGTPSAVTIGAVTETSPGVFSVQATPTGAGTLRLRINAGAVLRDAAGNNLNTTNPIEDDTTIAVDGTVPTLATTAIVDDKGGAPILPNTLVTYTLTFSEDINASTLTADDLGNVGSSALTFGTIAETTAGVFTVEVTPTTPGTLRLRVNEGAVVRDTAGNNLNTSSAIADNTTITVDGTAPTLAAASFVDDKAGGPIKLNTLVTYTVTFSEDMNGGTVTADDFSNAGDADITIGTVTEPTAGVFAVQVTPTTVGTVRLKVNAGADLKDVAGNSLDTTSDILDDTTIDIDTTPPTLAASSIVDNKGGGLVAVNSLVSYTVTFSEDMDASTVAAADFGNAGGATVTIGTVTETSPGVFTVSVTPTSSGTLQLRVNAGAVLKDVAGHDLDTSSDISDDTTLTVDATPPTLAANAIVDNKGGGPIPVNTLVTYTVTFSKDMDAGTVTAADFGNVGTSTLVFGAVTETTPGVFSVQVTPTSAGTLRLRVNATAVLKDAAGNSLNTASAIADDTIITVDGTAPTLATTSIVDNKGGARILPGTLVTYTLTFSEDMDASTVAADDFNNAGTSAVTIGAVVETTPGVFSVQATPTTAGTLQLRVKVNAVLKDVVGNNLNTATEIRDNTIITVDGTPPTLSSTAIVDNKSGVKITPGTLVTYTVTFSEDMNASTVTAADFGNAGTSTITFGAVTRTAAKVFTVQATPTTSGTLRLRVNAGAVLKDLAGNNLNTATAILDDTTITVDGTAPTLAATAIVDNKGGAKILPNTLVTYTVTFSEDMNSTTVTAADFGNAGTSSLAFGTITEVTPGVFRVLVTPKTAGTLRLRVNAGAVLKDVAGNSLNTASAISDNTIITVDGTPPTLASGSIVDNKGGAAVAVNTQVTYTVTFSEDMNASTVSLADFGNAGTAKVTIGTVTEPSPGVFTVPVKPTTAGTLRLRVNAGAVLKDVAGNSLNTSTAILDNTTITVKTTLSAVAGMPTADTSETFYTIDPATGLKYLAIVIHKSPGTESRVRVVEVSGNLTEWFSGSSHTTVLGNDANTLVVRDNTPVTTGVKRYIRLKP